MRARSQFGAVTPGRAWARFTHHRRVSLPIPLSGLGFEPITTTMVVKAGITAAVGAIAGWLARRRQTALQKEQATAAANEAERHLQELLEQWNASDKYVSQQTAALKAFDEVWAWLTSPQGCGNQQMGDPGRRCISERAAGGTVPGTGGNWFVWYRDPIAHDPDVKPDPVGSTIMDTGAVLSEPGAGLGIPTPLLLAGAALVAALTMGGK